MSHTAEDNCKKRIRLGICSTCDLWCFHNKGLGKQPDKHMLRANRKEGQDTHLSIRLCH